MGTGRFRAISRILDFEEPTDNLWYRLPPYEGAAREATIQDARRLGSWLFVRDLGDDATVRQALRLAGGWRRYPTEGELVAAREAAGEDRIRRAGVEFVGQLARRSPRPPLDEPLDAESIANFGTAARRRMIEANLRLVWVIARGIAGRGLDYVDLCQEGTIGLITAVEKFNPDLGWAFSTYATHWIQQAMTRAVADKGRLIRIPGHLYDKRPFLQKEHQGYRIPVAERASLRPIVSLEALPETAHPLVDDLQEAAEVSFVGDRVRLALKRLTEREQRVLNLRFGLDDNTPRTLEEIGREFSLTRERIRQIEGKALRRLRSPARQLHRLLDRRRATTWVEPNLPPWLTQAGLSDLEQRVLALRFGLAGETLLTIKQCAIELGVPGSQVLLIEQQVLRRLGNKTAESLRHWRWANRASAPATSSEPAAKRADTSPRESAIAPPIQSAKSTKGAPASLPAGDPPLRPEDVLEEARRSLKRLTNSERLIMTKRLGLDNQRPLSIDEVIYLYRYPRERVRAIEQSALLKMDPPVMRAVAGRLGVELSEQA